MSVWDELVGQQQAIEVFKKAAQSDFSPPAGSDSAMTHSWLITGPPGSGRSNLAYAFASALLCSRGGCGECSDCTQVASRTHPDLSSLTTERVIISIEEVRELVQSSQYSPSVSRYRVVVIEDADRMSERTSNVLLKALEEPPERTVWILCAPSEADLLPTIRSRVRSVRLTVPDVHEVARLISSRNNLSQLEAEKAARHAQSHIGMAQRLATNSLAAQRRHETVSLVLNMQGVGDAVIAAGKLLDIATEDAQALTQERDEEEREAFRRSLGISEGEAIPNNLRSHIKTLEEQQKRRATRSLRDGLDRILVDLLSLYRDILRIQLVAQSDIINVEYLDQLTEHASKQTSEETLATMEAISEARERIDANVSPVLALEALLIRATGSLARA